MRPAWMSHTDEQTSLRVGRVRVPSEVWFLWDRQIKLVRTSGRGTSWCPAYPVSSGAPVSSIPSSHTCVTPAVATTTAMAFCSPDHRESLAPSMQKRKRSGNAACQSATKHERSSRACHRCKAKKLKCHFTTDEARTYSQTLMPRPISASSTDLT